jgi:hypothetical protein
MRSAKCFYDVRYGHVVTRSIIKPPLTSQGALLDSLNEIIRSITQSEGGHVVAQLVDATNQKVAGLTHDRVIGIFHLHNPSGSNMALWSTQPLIEMSTRNIYWGEGGQCVRLTTLPPSCADVWKSGSHNLLEMQRPVRAV